MHTILIPHHMNHIYNAMYNFSQVWQEHDTKNIWNNMDVHSSVSMLIIMCHLNGQGSVWLVKTKSVFQNEV